MKIVKVMCCFGMQSQIVNVGMMDLHAEILAVNACLQEFAKNNIKSAHVFDVVPYTEPHLTLKGD